MSEKRSYERGSEGEGKDCNAAYSHTARSGRARDKIGFYSFDIDISYFIAAYVIHQIKVLINICLSVK